MDLVHQGVSGGFAALSSFMLAQDGKAALFCAFPYRSGGASRHAFLSFVPPSLAGMARGRVSMQRSAVYAAFEGVVGDLQVDALEGLQPEVVAAALAKLPGAKAVELE